ncbi:MAG: hypothetical protein HY821_00265 [Acidobacteria bacterium]|nr:hypothetical protein [Acidobacteriota bacterium]
MKRTLFSYSLTALALLSLAGCSSTSAPPKKVAKKAPEPVTGQSAIFQMFQVARTWAPDAMLLKVENGTIPEAAPKEAKYGLWRASFVSLEKKSKRDYVYSVSDSDGGIIKGARAGSDSPYVANPQTRPFAIQEVKIDTPAALAAALAEIDKDKDMKKVLAENKDLPVQYLLDWTGPTAVKPTWRVIFGATISTSKFSVFIDATTGKFVKKLR